MGGRARTRGAGRLSGAGDSPRSRTSLRLGPLLRAGGIWRDVPAAEVPEVFERIVTALPGATPPVRQLLGQRLRAEGRRDDGAGRRRFRPAASQRAHHAGPRLRHGGVVAPARRAACRPSRRRMACRSRGCFSSSRPRRARISICSAGSAAALARGPLRELVAQGREGRGNFSGGGRRGCGVGGRLKPEAKS